MKKLNKNIRIEKDIGRLNEVTSNRLDNDVGSVNLYSLPERYDTDVGKYHDAHAAPKSSIGKSTFGNIVRNKPNFYDNIDNKKHDLALLPSEIYKEKIKLEIYKSDYEVFKSNMFDLRTLIKSEKQTLPGFLTVRDFSNKLSDNNEKNKFR